MLTKVNFQIDVNHINQKHRLESETKFRLSMLGGGTLVFRIPRQKWDQILD